MSRPETGSRSSCSRISPTATGNSSSGTLAESGFDPLSRTCRFMLREEAHHMMVGTTGIDRVVRRTADLMREHDTDDIKRYGGIPLDIVQRYLNFHYSVSLDLFGGERSTNVANYFTAGLKGRWQEERRDDDHQLTDAHLGRRRRRRRAHRAHHDPRADRAEPGSSIGVLHRLQQRRPALEPHPRRGWCRPDARPCPTTDSTVVSVRSPATR